ncbi:MAG: RusA family crossover junction endodeoxyribonuclease [Chloroflexales bacterium]|nr:RusA family crossover junction endodeoxyribonuclease [Chloroflexales bacterium]
MILSRRPVSGQTESPKSKEHYKEELAKYARESFTSTEPLSGELYARIIWFCKGRIEGDIDNIIKPILDSVRGIVYQDDDIIVKCVSERFDKTRDLVISQINISNELYQDLLLVIADDNTNHNLYIEIGHIKERTVIFGPIDGVSA